MNRFLFALSIALLAACSSGGGGAGSTGTGATSTTSAAPASSTPASSTPISPINPAVPPSSAKLIWAYPNVPSRPATGSAGASATGSGSGSSLPSNGSAPTSGASTSPAPTNPAPTNTGATVPATPSPTVPASQAGAQLFGSIPADPSTSFSGYIFLAGEFLQPGSQVLLSYQGIPITFLPTRFESSDLLSALVSFNLAGDYRFEAVAPDGSISGGFDLTVPQGSLPGIFNGADPEVQMIYPSNLRQGFVGTMWIMGDNFAPGASLLVQFNNSPAITVPASYVNSRTLAWMTATPLDGDLTIRVINPDLRSSPPTFLTVSPFQASSGQALPAPQIQFMAGSITAPFVGNLRIYGSDILPGAQVEWKDIATGVVRTSLLSFFSSNETIWTLAYPQPGNYEVTIINPDGQRSATGLLDVQ